MKFRPENYDKATAEYEEKWLLLDNTLYELCRSNPTHAHRAAVNAKVWIVGRTAATGIERKIATTGSQGSANSQLAAFLWKNRRFVDSLIDPLLELGEPLTPEKLQIVIRAHVRFVNRLRRLLRKKQSSRSFVSKYLHFHCGIAPIYDNFAAAVLRKLVPWRASPNVVPKYALTDAAYYKHAMRFWELYQLATSSCCAIVSVKRLDHFLLNAEGVG